MRNCFIPFCDAICKDQPKRCMFHPPKNMYEIWKAMLPKQKEFKPSDKICERHFENSDIIRNFEQIINGEICRLERGRPRLKPNAIPYLNLPTDENLIPKTKRGRRAKSINESQKCTPTKRGHSDTNESKKIKNLKSQSLPSSSSSPPTKRKSPLKKRLNDKNEENENNIVTSCNIERIESCENIINYDDISVDDKLLKQQYDILYDDIFEIILPNTLWGIHRDPNRNLIAITYFDCNQLKIIKSIILNNKGELKIFLYNKLITEELLTEITCELLSFIINQIDEIKICKNAKLIYNSNDDYSNLENKCEIKIDNDNDNELCNECIKS